MTLTPKIVYMIIVLAGTTILIGDHFTSPALTAVGSPSELKSACAPCGAPCIDAEAK